MKEKYFFKRSYILIAAGMFFIINPLFHVVDVLPDVFGYILVYLGTAELAFLDGRMESARNKLKYLIALSAFKLLITPSVVTSSLDSDRLLAVSCFAIVEIILLIMLYNDFFGGFSYLADRNDGEKTSVAISNARFLTLIFFICRTFFPVLPELYSLADSRTQTEITYYDFYSNLMSTKPFVHLLLLLIVLLLGIFWYISFFKMLRTANREASFTGSLQQKYHDEYLVYPEKQRLKGLKHGLYTALIGLVFFLDISVDGIRILPETVAIVLISASALILKKYGSFKKALRLAPIICVLQVLTEAFRYVFIDTEAVLLSELELSAVAASSVIVVINTCATLLFMSAYLTELRGAYSTLTGKTAPDFAIPRLLFLVFTVLQATRIVLPVTNASVTAPHMLLVGFWLFLCGRSLFGMIEEYNQSVKLL